MIYQNTIQKILASKQVPNMEIELLREGLIQRNLKAGTISFANPEIFFVLCILFRGGYEKVINDMKTILGMEEFEKWTHTIDQFSNFIAGKKAGQNGHVH
jgi:hypothetical protein